MTAHQAETPDGIRDYIPILQWLPGYLSDWLRLDVTDAAGINDVAHDLAAEGVAEAAGGAEAVGSSEVLHEAAATARDEND